MQQNPNVRAQVAPLSKLQLSLEARELPNLDVLSKTDGQVFVYMLARDLKTWNMIGKTEVYKYEKIQLFRRLDQIRHNFNFSFLNLLRKK